jgi:hypothetical protein
LIVVKRGDWTFLAVVVGVAAALFLLLKSLEARFLVDTAADRIGHRGPSRLLRLIFTALGLTFDLLERRQQGIAQLAHGLGPVAYAGCFWTSEQTTIDSVPSKKIVADGMRSWYRMSNADL